jgi:hypothetical protein
VPYLKPLRLVVFTSLPAMPWTSALASNCRCTTARQFVVCSCERTLWRQHASWQSDRQGMACHHGSTSRSTTGHTTGVQQTRVLPASVLLPPAAAELRQHKPWQLCMPGGVKQQ